MKVQKCMNCTFYSAYYKQWSNCYGKLNHGYCSKYNKPQKFNETCDCFKSNEQKEQLRSKRRLKYLDNALIALTEIAQILKEKTETNLD